MRLRRRIPVVLALAALVAAPLGASATPLTVDQAIARAATENPSLRASLADVEAAHLGAEAAVGDRDPTLAATVQGSYGENASGTDDVGGTGTISSKVAITYTTDIGTKLEVGTTTDLGWRPTASGTISAAPTVTALAYVSARQPLLRGAGTDVNRASIVQADLGEAQARKQQALTASSTALDVLSAYWELWYADRAVAVQDEARRIAAKDYEDARARREELGTGTELDMLTFSQNLASLEDGLAQAKATRDTRAIALGRLLGMGAAEALQIEPIDALPTLPSLAPTEALVATALDRSPDLGALRVGIDLAKVRLDTAIDADQPQLDLFVTGSAGAQFSNYAGDYTFIGGRPTFSVVGGLSLSLPLGGGAAPSQRAKSTVELHAAEDRYQAKVDQIAQDVATKRIDATTAASGVALAEKTVSIAERVAKAQADKFALGTGDATDVVRAEQSVREAELRLLRAKVSAVTSGYALEHTTGDLIDGVGARLTKGGA